LLLWGLALAACLAVPQGAGAYSFGEPYVSATARERVVFDHSLPDGSPKDACEENDIPDLPARAFRDTSERVQLIASHATTRRMIGPSLDNLTHDCTVLMSSDVDSDPSRYDDREWIASPYTTDGQTIHALVHMEYQGWNYEEPPIDTSNGKEHLNYWYNAITSAKSTDGGESYGHDAAPTHLVASIPYTYEQVKGKGHYGTFGPSNIVKHTDGFYYSLIWSTVPQPSGPDERGICIMRTETLDSPTSWRAWDGSGFSVRFGNPYLESGADDCKRISQHDIGIQPQSLTWSTYLDKYVLVGNSVIHFKSQAPGFYYSTSDDLIHWSPRRLLMTGELPWTHECGDEDPIRDASLIDPSSPSRNFETIGQTAYLYFTRLNFEYFFEECWLGLDRDLLRIPIKFNEAAREPRPSPPPEPSPTSTSDPAPTSAPSTAPALPSLGSARRSKVACDRAWRRKDRLVRSLRNARRLLARSNTSAERRRYKRLIRKRTSQLRLARKTVRQSCR
jgi:hypothetical protein